MIYDTRHRPLRDLRLSVTDRCNFRCVYCMPKHQGFRFIPHEEMLSFEEITKLAKLLISLGVQKIRITGGEPLLRRHIENLIAQLAPLKTIEGTPIDLALTTNGTLLTQKAALLYQAGLRRITVSLDALDPIIFKHLNGGNGELYTVLKGIETVKQLGFHPIKINVVLKKGINDQEIIPIVRYFKGTGIIPRFIEYMDVGSTNGWHLDDVVPSSEVIRIIHQTFPIKPLSPRYNGETATRWQYTDGSGELGIISSVTHPFCNTCTRFRLSTAGMFYPCLFATEGIDLKRLLRQGANDEAILFALKTAWQTRDHGYSEVRFFKKSLKPKIEMSAIGG